jgi:hypothetical protein
VQRLQKYVGPAKVRKMAAAASAALDSEFDSEEEEDSEDLESEDEVAFDEMTLVQVKAALQSRGASPSGGNKAALLARLIYIEIGDVVEEEIEFDSMTKIQIQAALKSRGLSQWGATKAVLLKRLIDFELGSAPATSSKNSKKRKAPSNGGGRSAKRVKKSK